MTPRQTSGACIARARMLRRAYREGNMVIGIVATPFERLDKDTITGHSLIPEGTRGLITPIARPPTILSYGCFEFTPVCSCCGHRGRSMMLLRYTLLNFSLRVVQTPAI